jgi:hypothetical protein
MILSEITQKETDLLAKTINFLKSMQNAGDPNKKTWHLQPTIEYPFQPKESAYLLQDAIAQQPATTCLTKQQTPTLNQTSPAMTDQTSMHTNEWDQQ